ncbi:MAG: polymerase sigma-70 factor, subfamily [Blastocatellia bacterium]|jgi:RNA polymerase sigma-70 factor (ECF subfamily)|nr:polymerase sigma-70 factor, subfamily [Blastocatellia bacterium]
MSGDNEKEEAVLAAVKQIRPLASPPGELENLFREHHEQIFRTAHRITGSAADSEDVLQTVFLRLVRNREKQDLSANPKAYLLRAAINASLDLMRSRTRAKAVAIEDVETDLVQNHSQNPEQKHADSELRKLIQQAVARLGTTAAEMFVLRYFEGYENREIAEMTGSSQMVVGVILHRARTRLRKEIGEYLEKHHEE